MPRLISMRSFRTKRKTANVNRSEGDFAGCVFDDVCDDTVDEDESLLSQEPVLYSPQRSKRITSQIVSPCADDDTWVEVIIRLKPDPKTGVRPTKSLFYSIDRKKAYWDEPLSGASRIILSSDVVNPFTRMRTNNEFDKNVWVKFIVSARKREETRSLLWNCKTRLACWDEAPKKASRVISTDFMTDPCAMDEIECDEDSDDVSICSI